MKPHVYALHVEAVAAPREGSHLLPFLQLVEAHRAFHHILVAPRCGGGEDENGEGLEDARVEAATGGRCGGEGAAHAAVRQGAQS